MDDTRVRIDEDGDLWLVLELPEGGSRASRVEVDDLEGPLRAEAVRLTADHLDACLAGEAYRAEVEAAYYRRLR